MLRLPDRNSLSYPYFCGFNSFESSLSSIFPGSQAPSLSPLTDLAISHELQRKRSSWWPLKQGGQHKVVSWLEHVKSTWRWLGKTSRLKFPWKNNSTMVSRMSFFFGCFKRYLISHWPILHGMRLTGLLSPAELLRSEVGAGRHRITSRYDRNP